MTIASTTNKVRTDGTGAETEFNFTFKVFSASDLKVYLIDNAGDPTLLELTTHYTVAIDDPGPGGTVTMVTPPAADEELLIVREVALTQTTDIPVRGSLREPQIEFVYDRLVMMIQQLQEEIDRCVKVGVASETSEVPAFPAAVEDNVLGWDDSGNLKNIVLGTAVAAIITAAISTATADAEAAQTAAEAAQTAAEAAQTAAETAETNAETAETNAETAQTAAEVAQAAAEAAAAGVNMPSIGSGDALKLLRANAGETAFELVAIKDEDDMVSDSASDVPSQQSVKAYVDTEIAGISQEGSLIDVQVFTSSGTWTKPAGCTKALVKVVGGGGGGAGINTTNQAAAGGGGGGYSEKLVTSPGSTETVTVGAAGSGGNYNPTTSGTDGGTSSFGAHCSATGGTGGSISRPGGAGGIGISGDINVQGSGGGGGQAATNSAAGTGGAAGGGLGGGGSSCGISGAGNAGGPYGGGGGGGAGQANSYGGSGAAGVVIVYSYT